MQHKNRWRSMKAGVVMIQTDGKIKKKEFFDKISNLFLSEVHLKLCLERVQ